MKFLTILFLGLVQLFYSSQTPLLDQVKARGELRVVTRHGPTTYYRGPEGEAGLEYDLAKSFAEELGVELHIVVADNFNDILQKVASHEVDLATAGLTINDERKSLVRFAPEYQEVYQQVVYRQGTPLPPNNLAEFDENYKLTIVAGSGQSHFLKRLKENYPQLVWEEISEVDPSELLEQVWEGEIRYTLVNSNEVAQMRRFYPELEVGLEFDKPPQKLAWAFPRVAVDDSLYMAAIQFFTRLQRSGKLEQLLERYYGHIDEGEHFDYVNLRDFHRYCEERLPKYRNFFEKVASRYHLDWRFLAAVGYEESQWHPSAVSHTGVRGIMMLTKTTAQEMGVTNRDDPYQSIEGGTRYFLAIRDRIPKDILEPDRTWFALAAYNVGLGHLRDAVKLTEIQGDNPSRWIDVKRHLPKLSDEYWYKQTQHGQARGYEPVKFVKSVRRFYDMLVRLYPQPEMVSVPPQSVPSPQSLPNQPDSVPLAPIL